LKGNLYKKNKAFYSQNPVYGKHDWSESLIEAFQHQIERQIEITAFQQLMHTQTFENKNYNVSSEIRRAIGIDYLCDLGVCSQEEVAV
jgi:hypothetical protein